MNNIQQMLHGASTVALVCTQFGDSGKGKFVDVFGEWADVIARTTGGANAGHTIKVGEKEHVFHLIPSGILRDAEGKINVIGNGVAFDPRVVCDELDVLDREKLSYQGLRIALNARLVLPQHLLLDRVRERAPREQRIGTTGRGIGPAYEDHVARTGLFVNDLLNPDVFVRKLKRNIAEKTLLLQQFDPGVIEALMRHERMGGGAFWNKERIFELDAIVEVYCRYGKRIADMVVDTDALLKARRAQRAHILLEGSQGNLLSVAGGTYPYVTACDCTVRGLAHGAGFGERDVDRTFGLVKAFYMTRVGEGPFPTEIGGQASAVHCGDPQTTKAKEAELYPRASVNSADPFLQGIGIRREGNEYGATTGRPRRTGWLDLPLLRYSVGLTGRDAILTKLDVLDDCAMIKVCTAYDYCGPEYRSGDMVFKKGMFSLAVAVPDTHVLEHCVPRYEVFEGWRQSIRDMKRYGDLPQKLQSAIEYVEAAAGIDIRAVSVGPDREQTIFV